MIIFAIMFVVYKDSVNNVPQMKEREIVFIFQPF